MKKTISILILLILIPTLCFAGALQEKHRSVIAKKNAVVAGGTENIGSESAGTDGAQCSSTYMNCTKLGETPTQNGSVNSITFTATGDAGSAYGRLSLYTHDSANDLPNAVVANSATTEITVNSGAYADYTYTYSGSKPSVSSGAQYWLCVSPSSTGTLYVRKTDGAGRNALKTMTYGNFDAWGGDADGVYTVLFGKGYFVNAY